MMVGDLVRYKESTGWNRDKFGIITSIMNQWSVIVVWYGSNYGYMENIDVLEIFHEGR
tara:strand:- start:480 stop:653 length:174 start_codon:yes stop_codon:yes gene_type:complete